MPYKYKWKADQARKDSIRRNPEKYREQRRASQKRYRENHHEEWSQKNRDHLFRLGLKRFGLTQEEYDKILADQNGVCAICGQPEKVKRAGRIRRLHIDHDHVTGEVRGLLCHHCNIGLGNLKEDTTLLQCAINYLSDDVATRLVECAGC